MEKLEWSIGQVHVRLVYDTPERPIAGEKSLL